MEGSPFQHAMSRREDKLRCPRLSHSTQFFSVAAWGGGPFSDGLLCTYNSYDASRRRVARQENSCDLYV